MTLAEILAGLFPDGHDVVVTDGLILGTGRRTGGGLVHVLGIAEGTPLGIDGALALAGLVLAIARSGDGAPILMLIDSASQRMSRRDELLGLNEYLAHLAKALMLAEAEGHPTLGLLYGRSAAGAFIATALATAHLVALPGAHPEVMDLPSMARVTKLSLDVLTEKARATPVFAPGLDNLVQTGAIHTVWDPEKSLAEQLEAHFCAPPGPGDRRDRLGAERGGRPRAAVIAERVATHVTERA
ncbi:biotin-independent malonate decarboxylase subunit gamma [Methylobacterium sp. J-090]|uniref:biotin-independent malonate decarboxylase subunit gamma n=1 Tax=Methylobacterium sp. J-090 TaxID=2836666 RepID=UPI001FBA1D28|nr:biotin-independent malonate decarboxylase subunit gamma [Methylobacterium sp. J-090]MCJ2080837.1 biotin-independent malonate decarboxylase subunit gamma [Methylobacterium sp. J-090]